MAKDSLWPHPHPAHGPPSHPHPLDGPVAYVPTPGVEIVFPSQYVPGKAIKLPRQTRVTPEEYKEFLALGHGEIFDLDMDRCGQDLGEIMEQYLPLVWTGVDRIWLQLQTVLSWVWTGVGPGCCYEGTLRDLSLVRDRWGQDLGADLELTLPWIWTGGPWAG